MSGTVLARVHEALDAVHDPCSVAVNAPLGVRDMGLVRECAIDNCGHVSITLCVTSPSCILIGSIIQGVEDRVSEIPGVTGVSVSVDTRYLWTPEEMSERGRHRLDEARELSRHRLPVHPQGRRKQETSHSTYIA